ncbi:biotin-dependent carboxyltransferase family protein [Sutcliffiella horikoshii]|uniref:5-oxoprolinase subunit C family protein n=1 Tax=Sutcliffiella horikoshii TaxID=79883 RepID=UPI002041CB09|nr:biotin-dependent carboxyltransferase family protein [Sutcliffiella horikoshii]MCM3618176.1 biotin-dependent carboxyltransferase family protein [Sutcliffiella horikoshii]
MSSPLFQVMKPGLLTTVQDLGRTGYQEFGMVVAGAMDSYALQIGNLLVGNEKGEAALEVTIMGPELKALDDMVVAICGGNLSPKVNGKKAPMWKSFKVKKGELLEFGRPVEGARSYICVDGGYDVPVVMGSKSTYLKAQIGGFQGRALEKDDVLYGDPSNEAPSGRSIHPDEIPSYKKEMEIRVCLGPHLEAFQESSVKTLLESKYEVTPQSDRMGYRLKGPKIDHKTSADIISEAIPLGGIQVPADGSPILLMADRQTTGGYTRIATVISYDIPLLAQAQPGTQIRFREVTIEEAQTLYQKRAKFFSVLEKVTR